MFLRNIDRDVVWLRTLKISHDDNDPLIGCPDRGQSFELGDPVDTLDLDKKVRAPRPDLVTASAARPPNPRF